MHLRPTSHLEYLNSTGEDDIFICACIDMGMMYFSVVLGIHALSLPDYHGCFRFRLIVIRTLKSIYYIPLCSYYLRI